MLCWRIKFSANFLWHIRGKLGDLRYSILYKFLTSIGKTVEFAKLLKVYVQDLLWKDGARVSKLILKEEAYVYVCGGTAMASQVEDTLKRIIFQHGNMNQDQANDVVRKLKVSRTDAEYK